MITWLTPQIGTAAHHDVAGDPTVADTLVDVRELVDKGGNPASALLTRIDDAAAVLRDRGRVVVACDAGISRSRIVAIGVMVRSGWTLDDAIGHVRAVADKPELNLALLRSLAELIADPLAPARPRRTVLVLGGSGLVGRAVVASAQRSARVLCPSRGEIDLVTDAVELDLLVRREGVDMIVNAARAHPLHSTRAAGANLTMLRNVIEVAEFRAAHLVHLSTLTVFAGDARRTFDVVFHAAEGAEPTPDGIYSEGQRAGEMMVDWFRVRGGRATIVRLASVYGPGMPPTALVPKFIRLAGQNAPIVTHRYRNGMAALDLVHVDDAAEAISAITSADDPPTVAHVASGRTVTTARLAALIAELAGSRSSVSTTPIERETHAVTDVRLAALQRLGWRPRVSLRDGLSSLLTTEHNRPMTEHTRSTNEAIKERRQR